MAIQKKVTLIEIWQWPEFMAFAERLGIPLTVPTTALTIHLPIRGAVEIKQEFVGMDSTNAAAT